MIALIGSPDHAESARSRHPEDEDEGVGARSDGDTLASSHPDREFLLECGNLGPHDVPAAFKRLDRRSVDVGLVCTIVRTRICDGNEGHRGSPGIPRRGALADELRFNLGCIRSDRRSCSWG